MKSINKLVSLILAVALSLSIFSSCASEGLNKRYTYHFFNDFSGKIESDNQRYVAFDAETNTLARKDEEGLLYQDVQKTDKLLKTYGKDLLYVSDYFMAPTDAFFGRITESSDGALYGLTLKDDVFYRMIEGDIIFGENVVGAYKSENNYMTLSLEGESRVYLMLLISGKDATVKTYGLFDEFYSSIKVISPKIENTGFSIDTSVVKNGGGGKIGVKPNVSSYIPKNVTFSVINDGGYSLFTDAIGGYDLKVKNNEEKGDILINVSVDGLSKYFSLKAIYFAFDKSKFELGKVGEKLDLTKREQYTVFGDEFDNAELSFSVVDGQDLAHLNEGVLEFVESGYIVLEVAASFVFEEKGFVIRDRVAINIVDKESKENVIQKK